MQCLLPVLLQGVKRTQILDSDHLPPFLLLGQNTQYPQFKGGEVNLAHGFSPKSPASKTQTGCRGAWKGKGAQPLTARKQRARENQELGGRHSLPGHGQPGPASHSTAGHSLHPRLTPPMRRHPQSPVTFHTHGIWGTWKI